MTRSSFLSFRSHGLLRIAAATPRASSGDIDDNLESTLVLLQQAHRENADLIVFPELGISSYAIDDLLLQDAIHTATLSAIEKLVKASQELSPVLLVGAPPQRAGRLYNCALAISRGRILGVVPKTYLPNYREYYEKRWFASGVGLKGLELELAGQTVPFGTDLIFEASDQADFIFHIEICEDYWATIPPSSTAALAGALVLCNLSASNIVIGKSRERALLGASQSARAIAAYVYCASGPGESTTDLAWDGQSMIHELGELLVQSERFGRQPEVIYADVDLQRIRQQRMRTGTFNDAATVAHHPESQFRRIRFSHRPSFSDAGLRRSVARFPFVPADREMLNEDCYEAFNIQVEGLARRFLATSGTKMIVGVSGGLDSTHALKGSLGLCAMPMTSKQFDTGYTTSYSASSSSANSNVRRFPTGRKCRRAARSRPEAIGEHLPTAPRRHGWMNWTGRFQNSPNPVPEAFTSSAESTPFTLALCLLTPPGQEKTAMNNGNSIRDVMTRNPLKIVRETPIQEAARLMSEADFGTLIACKSDGSVCGIVTDRDIVIRSVSAAPAQN